MIKTHTDINRFITKILILLLGLVSFSMLIFFVGESVSQKNPDNYTLAEIDKELLLKQSQSPKCILVGGSNLAFGVDSSMISKELNMPVVNMGIQVGIGTQYMLINALQYARAGDVVIVVPEYQQFFGDRFYGKEPLFILVANKAYKDLNLLTIRQIISILKSIPLVTTDRIIQRIITNGRVPTDELYRRSGFNAAGDYVLHLNKPSKKFSFGTKITDRLNKSAIIFLADFHKDVKKKGARMYFIYPSFCSTSFSQSAIEIKELDRNLHLYLPGNIILSTPEEYMFKDSLFFDSPYHLNKIGRDIRTAKMVLTIKRGISM